MTVFKYVLENALCKNTGSKALRWIASFWGHLTPSRFRKWLFLKKKSQQWLKTKNNNVDKHVSFILFSFLWTKIWLWNYETSKCQLTTVIAMVMWRGVAKVIKVMTFWHDPLISNIRTCKMPQARIWKKCLFLRNISKIFLHSFTFLTRKEHF